MAILYFDESGNVYYITDTNCIAIVEIETWTTDLIEGSFGAYLYSDSTDTYITIIGIFESFDSSGESRGMDNKDLTSFSDLLIHYRQRILENR